MSKYFATCGAVLQRVGCMARLMRLLLENVIRHTSTCPLIIAVQVHFSNCNETAKQ